MPCGPVDGMDPVKVAKAVDEAILRARKGDGPTFLEMKTYRYRGHSMSDAQHYRTKDEVEEYKKIDPITKVKELILSKKYASKKQIEEIDIRTWLINLHIESLDKSNIDKEKWYQSGLSKFKDANWKKEINLFHLNGGTRPLYSIRHTYATDQYSKGTTIEDIAVLMNTSPRMVMSVNLGNTNEVLI